MDRTHRLLLINPYQRLKHYAVQTHLARFMGKVGTMPSLALSLVAALTPRDRFRISIHDEEAGLLPRGIDADLVGITTLSNTIDRAYELADRFRSRKVPVILGGPHVSYAPDEGLQHADAIVIGEAEGAWERLLDDFENSRLQRTYRNDAPAEFRRSPPPRWDAVPMRQYLSVPVQATRGCPYGCEFCLVTNMFGRKVRSRDVDDLMQEIEAAPLKRLFFVDDNLTFNRRFARELLSRMRGRGYSWICQASIDIAAEPDLLDQMAEAGCESVLIGFESLNPANLQEAGKFQNLRADYEKAIAAIHAAGIQILASFVTGFDHDTTSVFDDIAAFAEKTNVTYVTLNILGCSVGTALRERMARENRLPAGPLPPHFHGGMFPAMQYRNMSGTVLFDAYLSAACRLYAFDSLAGRSLRLFGGGTFTRRKVDRDLTVFAKGAVFLKLFAAYVMTPDRAKRRMFFGLLRVAIRHQAAMERVVVFLLGMEGLHWNVSRLFRRRQEMLREIADAGL